MTANHGSVNIAVPGPNHSLRFYWAVNGTSTWHAETIAGGGSTFSAPSMTVNGNSVNIATVGSGLAEVLLGRQRHRHLAPRDRGGPGQRAVTTDDPPGTGIRPRAGSA